MITTKIKTLGLVLGTMFLATSALTGGAILLNDSGDNAEKVEAYTNGDASTYYSGISDSATGTTLLSALQSLNNTKRQSTVGYGNMWDYYSQTDGNGSQYYGFYTGILMNKSDMNKEHVWPNSHGGGSGGSVSSPYVEADIHMPRPSDSSDNSSRGNSYFVEGGTSSSSGWDPVAGLSNANENYRGSAARIVFYCMVADSDLALSDSNSSSTPDNTMGKISDLLKWNLNYPVSTADAYTHENQRNEAAESIQGNRNPFIDHPEYACKIWGDFNSTTQSICAASSTAPTSLTMSSSSATLAVGGTVALSVTANSGASNSVTWSTNNSSVATVSGGTVTGVSAGTATITATSTVDTSIKATCSITVKAVSSITQTGTLTKTSYESNESFDPSGLTFTATWSDSTTSTIAGSDISWGSLVAGASSVTGTYGGAEITITGLTITQATGGTAMYTVASTSSVTTDTTSYTYPSGSSATFANTYTTANQMTSGNSQTLTLSNYSGLVINNITLSMKSNAKKGAGGLKYSLDGGTTYTDIVAAETNFSDANWNGSYTDAFTDISKTVNISVSSSIMIVLTASTNSLYCQSYSIGWTGGSTSSVAVTGVTLSSSSLSLSAGDTSTLTATIAPSDATNQNVSWTSSDASVASVSGGVVTALSAGATTITATTSDGSFTATCSVSVSARTLSSISVSGQTTGFVVGDTFAFGGTCTATYSNSTTSTVTPTSYSGYDMSTAGSQTVTVTYTESGVSKTASYDITVSAVAVSSIAVTTAPSTTSYMVGGTFSSTGLVVTATYNNGSTAVVTSSCTLSSPDMTTSGDKTITITYSGDTSITTTTSITVSAYSASIDATASVTVSGTASISCTANADVTWSTAAGTGSVTLSNQSNTSVTITGVAAGTATVTATVGSGSYLANDSCTVTITDASDYTYNLVTNASNLVAGDTCIIVGSTDASAFYSMNNASTSSTLPWYYSATSVTPSSGVITQESLTEWTVGKSSNYYTFTNNSTDFYGYVNGTHYSLNYGSTYTLSGTDYDVVNSYSGVNTWTYTMSDSSTGLSTLYANSSANVYLAYTSYGTFSGASAAPSTGGIYIYKKGTSTSSDSVSLDKTSASIEAGNTTTLTATASGDVTWSSNNESVATVSGGVVTAVAAGNATITATCGTATATCSVTVVASGSSSDSVSLNKSVASTTVSSTVTLTATASGTVTWTTSDSSIATVSGGVVTGVAIGTCIITATVGTASASCEVTVSGTISGGSSDGSYTKVTAAPSDWSGTYVIVYETGSLIFDGSLTTLDAASNYQSVTITDSTITKAAGDPYSFTIAASDSSYSIKSTSGYYIGTTANSNSLKSSTSTVYTNTLTYNSGNIDIVSSGGAYLRYNKNADSSSKRFRYYKSSSYTSQQAIQLYKYTAGSSGELTDAQKAEQFAVNFNAANVCGTDNNTSAISSIWLEQQTAFTALDLTVQTYLTGVVTSDTTTYSAAVIACVTRYDRVISLYYSSNPTGFPNFMSRITSSSNRLNTVHDNSSIFVLSVGLIATITLVGASYLFLKKKKHN